MLESVITRLIKWIIIGKVLRVLAALLVFALVSGQISGKLPAQRWLSYLTDPKTRQQELVKLDARQQLALAYGAADDVARRHGRMFTTSSLSARALPQAMASDHDLLRRKLSYASTTKDRMNKGMIYVVGSGTRGKKLLLAMRSDGVTYLLHARKLGDYSFSTS